MKMLDKKDLEEIRKRLEAQEEQRSKVISISNDIIKTSKTIIYALHRNEVKEADKAVKDIQKKLSDMVSYIKGHPKLNQCGAYKVAIQEYVEALCFYNIIKDRKIPSSKDLDVDEEFFLLGLMDLTGELVRKAINASIKGDYKESLLLKDVVSEIYDELMRFNFGNSELRKKFDGIKYDLKKLEDLALNLKLSNKI
jgi:predicted translin family RNA/ssDNA-binding protein